MKKLLFSFLFVFLPMMAMGQTNQGVVIAEADFTTATEFTGWCQFADEQTDGKVEIKADEGLAITVGVQTGQLWQPQIMVIPDGSFDIEEDGKYKVIVTAKFPSAGTLRISMGSWSANDHATFPVAASDDFQTIECNFEYWSVTTEDAHLLFQCGDFKGTTILKKIQVLDMEGGASVSNIAYNFISKGKIAEVIHKNYKGEVVIPPTVMYEGDEYTVAKIADYAFRNCTNLTSVSIPSSVTSIGSSAFYGCSNLSSVSIPSSVASIGNYAFEGCNRLSSVHISDLKKWCNISFNNNPLSYAHHLFMNGQEIKDLVIPSDVTSIGSYAFSGCSGLTSVTIPNNVTSIGYGAFSGCSGLTSVTIPNSVTNMDGAFYGCIGLTSVTLPNNITTIDGAFSRCSGLTSIIIPNSIISIGGFSDCTSLSTINIPNNVNTIRKSAFAGCSGLTTVNLGSGVQSIDESAFARCKELKDVYCLANNVPNTDQSVFENSYIEYATLHVPAASLEKYKNANYWKNFGNIVTISNGDIPETKTCAKPTITFKDGKLTFTCATEGVEYVSEITAPAMTKKYDNEISLSSTYTVTVYATRSVYNNSEKASIEIQANSGIRGDLTDDGKVDVADHVELSNIIMGKIK